MLADSYLIRKKNKQQPQAATAVITVKNDRGLHTRPSTEIVKLSARFSSQITLVYKKTEVNARSLLGILMLAAERGAKIRIRAEGIDAQVAVDSLVKLAESGFNTNY